MDSPLLLSTEQIKLLESGVESLPFENGKLKLVWRI